MTLKELVHPNIWTKGHKEDIILYALSVNGPLTPTDFIREGDVRGKFTKTTFYKYFSNLLLKKYVITEEDEKNRKRVNYLITNLGEIYLAKRLIDYGLDYGTLMDIEMRKSKNLTNQMKLFFQELKITDDQLKLECITLASILSYEKVHNFLKDESKYYKIILFLAQNHPKFYPKLTISAESFITQYNTLSENVISIHEIRLFIEKLIEKNEYGIEFHRIKSPCELYFAADSEYGKIFKLIVDSHLKRFIHRSNLGIDEFNQEGLKKSYRDIIFTLIEKYKLFEAELKAGLFQLINEYRIKIRDNLVTKTEIVLEYARTSELPELPLEEKSRSMQEESLKLVKRIPFDKLISSKTIKKDWTYDSIKDLQYFSKIWELYNDHRNDEALIHINKVLELEEIPELYFWKADILRYSNPKEALQTIEKGIEINPMPRGYNFYLLKALVLDYIKKYEDALKAINSGLKFDDDVSLYELKAKMFIKLGRIDDCIDLSDKFKFLSSKYINDIISIEAEKRLTTPSRATRLINIVLKRDPNHLNSLAVKTHMLIGEQKFDEASKIIDKILSLEYDFKSFNLYDLTRTLNKLGRHKDAIHLFRIVIKHTDYYVNPYVPYYYAETLNTLRLHEEALDVLENLKDFDPLEYNQLKAKILLDMKRYDEGLYTIDEYLDFCYKNDIKIESIQPFLTKIELLIFTKTSGKILNFLDKVDEKWTVYQSTVKLLIDYDMSALAHKVYKKFCDVTECSEESRDDFIHDIMIDYYNEIYYAIKSKNFNKALQIIELYSKFYEGDSQIYNYKIEICIQQKKFDEALSLTNEAIKLWPKSPVSYPPKYWIGDDECPESEKIYHYEYCRIKARVLLLMNRIEEALDVIDKVIILSPKLHDAYYLKTIILLHKRNFETALEQINSAIYLNSNDAHYYYVKSEILRELSRDSDALEPINKAIELNPKYPKYFLIKSKILINIGKNEEALETLEIGIKISPGFLKFYEVRNLILNLLGRYDEALVGIDEALKRGIQYDGIYFEKARLLHSMNNYEVALDTINKALDEDPRDSLSITLKIKILNEQENYEEALAYLESRKELIHADDTKSDSYNNLKTEIYYTKAKVFARNNMKVEAIQAIKIALELINPESAEYNSKYGKILMILQDYSSAVEKFKLALQQKMPPFDTKVNLGKCYYEMRKYDNAYINLDEGIEQVKQYIKEQDIKADTGEMQDKPLEKKLIEEAEWQIATIDGFLNPELQLSDDFSTEIFFNIGDYIIKKGNYDYAMMYFERGRNVAIERNEPEWIKKADNEIKRYKSFVKSYKEDLYR